MNDDLVGTTVTYRPNGGGLRTVFVEDVDMEGKNGRVVFDGILQATSKLNDVVGDGVWGYVDQII